MNSSSTILLVEDDVVDVMSVTRALRELHVPNPLAVAGNGEEALERLHDARLPLPGIILLDLNMPRMNGLDFLKVIRGDTRFRRLPIIILTTSKEESDRLASFNLGVAGYMTKPVDYARFVEVMRTIQNYWAASELPP